MRTILTLLFCVAGSTYAQYCPLVGKGIYAQDQNGTFLGGILFSPFDALSIMNEFGSYGSPFSSTSILNEFSNFGSEFASYSAYNPFTSTPPMVISQNAQGGFLLWALITKNQFAPTPSGFIGTVSKVDPDALFNFLAFGSCSGVSIVNPLASQGKSLPKTIVDVLGRSIRLNQNVKKVAPIISIPPR